MSTLNLAFRLLLTRLRASCGFMRPFLYDCMLIMRGGGYFILVGLVFCCCFIDPARAWPEKPPEEFAGPYNGKLTVNRVPVAELPSHCKNLKVLGCSYWDQYTHAYCTVYIPNDVPEKLEAAILEHELGHL